MPITRSSYLPVVRQPMRFAVHEKEALDEGMESDPERVIFSPASAATQPEMASALGTTRIVQGNNLLQFVKTAGSNNQLSVIGGEEFGGGFADAGTRAGYRIDLSTKLRGDIIQGSRDTEGVCWDG